MIDATTTIHEELPLTDTVIIAQRAYTVTNVQSHPRVGKTAVIVGERGACYLVLQTLASSETAYVMRAVGTSGRLASHIWRGYFLSFDGSILTVYRADDLSSQAFRIA